MYIYILEKSYIRRSVFISYSLYLVGHFRRRIRAIVFDHFSTIVETARYFIYYFVPLSSSPDRGLRYLASTGGPTIAKYPQWTFTFFVFHIWAPPERLNVESRLLGRPPEYGYPSPLTTEPCVTSQPTYAVRTKAVLIKLKRNDAKLGHRRALRVKFKLGKPNSICFYNRPECYYLLGRKPA